jgi:peptidoglycan/LPS O-acetylase OafA/YrhL
MNARSARFPLFDSLRAIAAISVVGTHAAFQSGFEATDSPFVAYTARLEVGVAIFFLISGFLLYRPFVAARMADEPRLDTRAYAWRRFLRILPAYWAALTITALVLGLPSVFTWEGGPLYYGFAQIYSTTYVLGGLPQAWTLCTEITFYAFLPLFALAVGALPARTRRGRYLGEAAALATIFLVAVAWKLWRVSSAADPDHANAVQGLLYLPAFLDQFAIGMGLAVMSVAVAERGGDLWRWLRPLDRFPALGWLLAAVSFWAVSTQIGLDGRNPFSASVTADQVFARHYLYALVGLGLLLPVVFGDQSRGLVRRFLSWRVMLYLGVVSYGIYLWHYGVFTQLAEWQFLYFDNDGPIPVVLIWFAVGLSAAVVLATISWFGLEKQLLRLKRLVPDRRRSSEVAARGPGAVPEQPVLSRPGEPLADRSAP